MTQPPIRRLKTRSVSVDLLEDKRSSAHKRKIKDRQLLQRVYRLSLIHRRVRYKKQDSKKIMIEQ